MTARKKDIVQRNKPNLSSSPSTDENVVAINNNQFDSDMNDVMLVLDTQETDSFLLNAPRLLLKKLTREVQ